MQEVEIKKKSFARTIRDIHIKKDLIKSPISYNNYDKEKHTN